MMAKTDKPKSEPKTVEVEFLGEAPAFGLKITITGFGSFRKASKGDGKTNIPAVKRKWTPEKAAAFKARVEDGRVPGKWKIGGTTVTAIKAKVEARLKATQALEDAVNAGAKPEDIQPLQEALEALLYPEKQPTNGPAPEPGGGAQ